MDVLEQQWKAAGAEVTRQHAEAALPEDLLKGDVLILGSGTWNTGSIEGQLNPHMHVLLKEKAKDFDLKEKKCSLIALGDERYYYTARAGEHMRSYIQTHNGTVICDPLTIINEPFGQEERIQKWGKKLLSSLK